MKLIPLTRGVSAMVDDEDFEFLMQWKWCAHKTTKGKFYAVRSQHFPHRKHKTIRMHRVLLGLTDSKTEADHIDRNPLNNQKHNLRIATRRQNAMNLSSFKGSTSEYVGVSWEEPNKKWRATIFVNNKKVYLGLFIREDHAALARNTAAIKYFGERANLNVVQDNGLFQRLRSY